MQDFQVMQSFKSLNNLNYNLPYVLFFHKLFGILTITYSLEDVPIICEFHDNTN